MDGDYARYSKRRSQQNHIRDHHNENYPKSPIGTCGCLQDCFWLLLLVVFVGANCVFFYEPVINSKYQQLTEYYNNQGQKCGGSNLKDYKYAYVAGVGTTFTVDCLEKCPDAKGTATNAQGKEIDVSVSQNYIGNLCIPTKYLQTVVSNLSSNSAVSGLIGQIPIFAKYFPIFIAVSLAFCILYICVLKSCAKPFIMICQFIWIAGLLCLMAYGIFEYGQIKYLTATFGQTDFWTDCDWVLNWVLILAAPIYLAMFFCCIYKNLIIASSIIEAGCDAFGDLPSALIVPLGSMVFMILNAALWVFVCMSIVAEGVSAPTDGSFSPVVSISDANYWWLALAVFNLIYWIIFWGSFGDYVLVSMFTDWYFYQNGESDISGPPNAIGRAFVRALQCMGTVAIGALLITFATILRIVLFIFSAEQKVIDPNMGTAAKCFYGMLNCIAWLIEKICQQFTKYGFINSSFTGDSFCTSAWTSMCVNLYNIGIFTMVQFTETLISTGGNLLACVLNMVLAYFMFYKWMDFGLTEPPYGIMLLIGVILYFLNAAVLSVWDLATDCVMYCFFFDYDRKGEPPVNYPYQLKSSLEDIIATKKAHDKENDDRDSLLQQQV